MKAVRVHQFGDEDALQIDDLPMPEPGPDQVIVKMEAASINRLDLRIREQGNSLISADDLPVILGQEAAGTVTAVGENVSHLKVGQRVAAAEGSGCYSEYAVATAERARPLPEGMDAVMAACVPWVFLTAYWSLEAAEVKAGDQVFIQSGSGGVGMAAIQIAKHLGTRVITTAGTDEKCAKTLELGADDAINYNTHEFGAEVLRLTDGRGVDVLLESIGGDAYRRSLELVAQGGHMIGFGRTSGITDKTPPPPGISVQPHSVGTKLRAGGEHLKDLDMLLQRVHEGTYKVIVDRVLPMSQVAEAHRHMEGRRHFGKVVLIPD